MTTADTPCTTSMPLLTFYGSCQTEALYKVFVASPLAQTHRLQLIINWKYMLDAKPLPDLLWETDMLVYQPFRGTDAHAPYSSDIVIAKIRETKPLVRLVAVPFMTWTAYFPGYTRDPRDVPRAGYPFGKFPSIPRPLVGETDLERALANLTSPDAYSADELQAIVRADLEALERREKVATVRVAEFVKRHWRQQRLFHSSQHPCNGLLRYVLDQTIDQLGVRGTQGLEFPGEMLGEHIPPILPSVQQHLNLEFSTDAAAWFKGAVVSLDTFVREAVTTLSQLPPP